MSIVDDNYRAKIAARAAGTVPIIVQPNAPVGEGSSVEERYRAKIEARSKPAKAEGVPATTPAPERESSPAVGVAAAQPKVETKTEEPAREERRDDRQRSGGQRR